MRIPLFALSICTSICAFTAQSMAMVSLPFLFESTLGLGQVRTGLLMTPWPLVVAVIAPFTGRLADRYPVGILSGAGLTVLAVGWAGQFAAGASEYLGYCMAMLICGLGFGFFNTPNNRAIIISAPSRRSGGLRDAGVGSADRADDRSGPGGAGVGLFPVNGRRLRRFVGRQLLWRRRGEFVADDGEVGGSPGEFRLTVGITQCEESIRNNRGGRKHLLHAPGVGQAGTGDPGQAKTLTR